MKRCSGHCCRWIVLPADPETIKRSAKAAAELRRLTARWEAMGRPGAAPVWPDPGVTHWQDIERIAEIMVHLETRHRGDLNPTFSTSLPDTGHFYMCKVFDLKAGNCTEYDDRPSMCSQYPYGTACELKGMGCTYEAATLEEPKGTPLRAEPVRRE